MSSNNPHPAHMCLFEIVPKLTQPSHGDARCFEKSCFSIAPTEKEPPSPTPTYCHSELLHSMFAQWADAELLSNKKKLLLPQPSASGSKSLTSENSFIGKAAHRSHRQHGSVHIPREREKKPNSKSNYFCYAFCLHRNLNHQRSSRRRTIFAKYLNLKFPAHANSRAEWSFFARAPHKLQQQSARFWVCRKKNLFFRGRILVRAESYF